MRVRSDGGEGEAKGETYKNGRVMQVLGWLLFSVIVIANSYVLVQLMLGKGT